MANKIRLGRATKARIETIKETLSSYELVYSMDTRELGVKNSDGTVTYIGAVTELDWSNILNKPTFAPVATSGSYNDLTGKPDLSLKLDKNFSALPEQTSPLLTDVLVLNRGTTVQKVTLGNLLAQVDNEIFRVVGELPATGLANKIYLVPSNNPDTQNVLEEYIWVNDAWEKIGAVRVDLSNYYTKAQITSMLQSKVDRNADIVPGTYPKITYDAKGLVTGGAALTADDIPSLSTSKITTGTFATARIPNLDASKITSGVFDAARIPNLSISKITNLQTALDGKVDKVSGKGLSTNDYTNTDKAKVANLPDNTISELSDINDELADINDELANRLHKTNDLATLHEAEEGQNVQKWMNPLRVKQAIQAQVGQALYLFDSDGKIKISLLPDSVVHSFELRGTIGSLEELVTYYSLLPPELEKGWLYIVDDSFSITNFLTTLEIPAGEEYDIPRSAWNGWTFCRYEERSELTTNFLSGDMFIICGIDQTEKVVYFAYIENNSSNLYVPLTRQINGKSLSTDITLTTADISETTGRRYVTDTEKSKLSNLPSNTIAELATKLDANSIIDGGDL